MTSAPTSGHVPSASRTSSSPPTTTSGPQGPLSSKPVQPQYVALEQSLLRSDTANSKISTASTLVDSDKNGNSQAPPSTQASANTRFASSLSVHSEVAEPEAYAAQLPGPIPKSDNSSAALPADKDGFGGNGSVPIQNVARAESVPPFTILWINSLLTKIPRKILFKNACSLVGFICGIVSTLTYTYRSYMISLWQAEHAFYDHCREWASQPGELGFDVCSVILHEALRQPPYVRSPITVKHQKRDLPVKRPARSLWTWCSDDSLFYLINLVGLFFTACAMLVLCLFLCRRWRRAPWCDVDVFWPPHQGPRQPSDVFSPMDVRTASPRVPPIIEGFNSTTNRGWTRTSTEKKHLANTSHKRRFVSVLLGLLYAGSHTTRSRRVSLELTQQPLERISPIDSEGLRSVPLDPASAQGDSETTSPFQTASIKTKRRPLTQIGDALKGRCDDERILPFRDSEDLFDFLRRKVDSKSRKLSARLRRPR